METVNLKAMIYLVKKSSKPSLQIRALSAINKTISSQLNNDYNEPGSRTAIYNNASQCKNKYNKTLKKTELKKL